MTDNVTVPATGSGTATPVVATDDVAGVHYQRVKLVDGTLDATGAIGGDATNGLDVDVTRVAGGSIAHDGVGTTQSPLLVGGYASAAAPTDVSADGDAVRAWLLRNGSHAVTVTAAGALVGGDAANGLDVDVTRLAGGTLAHDAVGTSQNPHLVGGFASAAAPADVSADGDATRLWVLRNGATAVNVTAAGALIAGDAANGLDVDVTRLSGGAIAHDGVGTSQSPVLVGGYASAAAPSDVSADGDATRAWLLRNGAHAVAITAAGALIGGDATGGLHSQGAIAHDGVDSGNPVKVGGKATTSLAAVSTAGDRTNNISDMYGRQLTSHIDPAMQIYKSYNDTASRAAGSAQIIWTPAGGKKIAITNLVISAYGTTSARMFLFFAAAADLTYSAGTDQPVFVGSFSPSATAKPGMVLAPATPIFAATADYKLLYQNDAALSVDITVYGYEF